MGRASKGMGCHKSLQGRLQGFGKGGFWVTVNYETCCIRTHTHKVFPLCMKIWGPPKESGATKYQIGSLDARTAGKAFNSVILLFLTG